jgi:5-methyltetrahydropteroyltriglutamate--homocysteine methyltransferase
MPLRTTVAGSWWPYQDLNQDLGRYHRGELQRENGIEVVNQCAGRAIAEQREFGFDEWTGGEYFADTFVAHIQPLLTGVVIEKLPEPDGFDYDDLGLISIVGDIDAPNGLGYAEAFKRENALPGGVTKSTVLSPFELVVTAMGRQYDVIQAQLPRLCEIVKTEIKELAEAGCPHIQLDAPAIGAMINQGFLSPKQGAEIIATCFEGISGVIRGLHLCNGNNRGRPGSAVLRNAPWVPLLQELDGVIDIVHVEASYYPEYLEREAYKDLPPKMQLAAGIVDEANYWIESVKKIKERAADWSRVVGEERFWLAPSCGFGRHSAREGDHEVLYAKMTNLAEAAATF